jgi:hypothetical protein
MARREGGADGVDKPVGRAGAINQCLEKRGEGRCHALGDGEGDDGEPATSANEAQPDEREREGTTDPAPNPIENKRKIGE